MGIFKKIINWFKSLFTKKETTTTSNDELVQTLKKQLEESNLRNDYLSKQITDLTSKITNNEKMQSELIELSKKSILDEAKKKVLEEMALEASKKAASISDRSSIMEGDAFEKVILKKLEDIFGSSKIKHISKNSGTGDIAHLINFNNIQSSIIYEIKHGKFSMSDFVKQMKNTLAHEKNSIAGVIIAQQLPKTEMIDKGLSFYQVPDSNIYVASAEHLESLLPLFEMYIVEQVKLKDKIMNDSNITNEQRAALEIVQSSAFQQNITDLINNLAALEKDIENEKDSLEKIIKTRYNKQMDYIAKATKNSINTTQIINKALIEIKK